MPASSRVFSGRSMHAQEEHEPTVVLIRASVRSIDTHYCDCYLHRGIFKSKKLAGTMSAHSARLLKKHPRVSYSLTQLDK